MCAWLLLPLLLPVVELCRFVKLCREAGLFDAHFATSDADIIFAKVKTKVRDCVGVGWRCGRKLLRHEHGMCVRV